MIRGCSKMENEIETQSEKSISSFELTKNSKGYNWKIKVYNEDIEEAIKKAEKANEYAKSQWSENERRDIQD